jgi:hypothetical protein
MSAGAGINYAGTHSTVNLDIKTGIRYGVISQHKVLQAWADSSEAVYPEPSEIDDIECPECGFLFHVGEGSQWGDRITCPNNSAHEFELGENMELEAQGYDLNDGEYVAFAGDDGDIFIISSPYYTYAQFCSPCAPGAIYLMSPTSSGEKGFCFSHDWFDDMKAPYPVYRVDNDEEVHA